MDMVRGLHETTDQCDKLSARLSSSIIYYFIQFSKRQNVQIGNVQSTHPAFHCALCLSDTHSGTRYELSRYPVEEENLTSHCDNSGLSGIEWFGIYLENIMTSYVR